MLVGLNLKDEETVALVSEVAQRLGTTKTGAVRELAREKLAALDALRDDQHEATLKFLEEHVWRNHPPGPPLSKAEREQLLGYDEMFGT